MNKLLLKDCCGFQEGYVNPTQKNRDFFDGPIKWLRASDLNDGIVNDTEKTLSQLGFDSAGKSSFLFKPHTIAISKSGTIGKLGILNDYMCGNRAVINIDVKDSIADLKYVFYTLKYKKNEILGKAGGSIQKNLYISALETISLNHLELSTQKQIAKVLSDLDAKIEVNNNINQELEAMAKTLYDYWFVQFDFPDANGKPYKSSGGKMVFNEALKREIPEGWEVDNLLSIADFQNGLACQKYRPINEDFLRVIKIKDMKEGFSEKTEKVRPDVPDKIKIFNGDILFSWSASLEVIQWSGGNGALNQHIFKVTSEKYPKSYYYFELLNYLQHFKMQAELRKTTMGHITQEHLKQSRITIPSIDLINKLDEIINPILNKQVKLNEENQKLSELRDWLLPMLMNGQVTVGEEGEKYKTKK
ncbi:restriction endonuclease subunit S [Psychroserpens luteus]|uniref:Restriction endonuclease subunit S n=1 Tax=Psychroserpens luteus TaxID=1434066 RepID=A0ABW5ZQS7_9FLAO|nr:restriction endonuclease subunit S [Psychroserpens luteus]